MVSPLLSISWRLITPYIRPFCFKNDGKVVTLARTAFDASCAAWCRSSCTLIPVSCSGNCRNCARASCTSWCGDTRGLCAQQWFGWVTNVFGYRSSGAALRCAVGHRQRCGHPLPIVVTYALVVAKPCAWAGATRVATCTALMRFGLRGQSAPSCAHCCVRMRIRCTRLPIPLATRMHI